MLQVEIEYRATGPLSRKRTLYALEEVVEKAVSLEEAARAVNGIPMLAAYRGGSHVAVHPANGMGGFENGSRRLAIVTEG